MMLILNCIVLMKMKIYNTFSVSQKSFVKLMNLLDDMEAPDYAFQSIMQWAQECYLDGLNFNPSMTHKANLTWMYKSIHNSKHMLPHLEKITLPDPLPRISTMDVICYNFVAQLLSILQDKSIMTRENVVLDPDDPLAMFEPKDGCLGEALSVSFYCNMYAELVTDPTRQLLVPLIAYIDATKIDTLNHFTVEPFTFTPSICVMHSNAMQMCGNHLVMCSH